MPAFLASLIGLFCWNFEAIPYVAQALTPLVLVLWFKARSRLESALIIAMYYGLASYTLAAGTATFFESSLTLGIVTWFSTVLVQALIASACWHSQPAKRSLGYVVLVLVWVFIPIGWAHPLIGTSWVFVGLGWGGLLLGMIAMLGLAYLKDRYLGVGVGLWLCIALVLTWLIPINTELPKNWHSQNTYFNFGVGTKLDSYVDQYIRSKKMQSQIKTGVNIYPETVGGVINDQIIKQWQAQLKSDETVLIGGYLMEGTRYYNTVLAITKQKTEFAYKQRLPMPLGMWKPFSNEGAIPNFNGNSTYELGSIKPAFLLCYESLIVWPIVQSYFEQPTILVLLSSTWWASANIKAAEVRSMKSWGRLLNLPTIEVFNL